MVIWYEQNTYVKAVRTPVSRPHGMTGHICQGNGTHMSRQIDMCMTYMSTLWDIYVKVGGTHMSRQSGHICHGNGNQNVAYPAGIHCMDSLWRRGGVVAWWRGSVVMQ